MPSDIIKILERSYGLSKIDIIEAPRGFVGETYFVDSNQGKFFLKLTDKPLLIDEIINSLAVLEEMYLKGIWKINYPIRTKKKQLFLIEKDTLIILYNYIHAEQSYNYDYYQLGKLLAEIHAITPKIESKITKENFQCEREVSFIDEINYLSKHKGGNEIHLSLAALINKHKKQLLNYYEKFLELRELFKTKAKNFVITHGDSPGNVLVKSFKDFYIVDWDQIILSPPERDLWFVDHEPGFLDGYKSVFPNYKMDLLARKFMIYKRYLHDSILYFAELTKNAPKEYKQKKLEELTVHFSKEGWIVKQIEKLKNS